MTNTNTKRALVFSLVSLLVCLSMFVGSTFAWFTDSASTKVNSIVAGNLKIGLLMNSANGWTTAEGTTLPFVNEDGSKITKNILWEPGATYNLPEVKIVNEGNLDVVYKVIFRAGLITENLQEVIDVRVSGQKVGTLAELMNDTDGMAHGTLLAGKETAAMAISLHMQEGAGNEYQDAFIRDISVTVLATQAASEYDSTGNQYDIGASFFDDTVVTITTAEELFAFAKAVNEEGKNFLGQTIELGANIDLQNQDWEPIGQTGATTFKGVFDGKGYTISNLNVDSGAEEGANYASGLFGWIESHGNEHITIKNVIIDGAKITGHHNVAALVGYGYVTIDNCHVKNATITNTVANDDANGDKTGGIIGYVGEDARISNCTVANSAINSGRDAGQVAGAAKTSTIINCSATNVTVTANGTGTGANINETVIGRVLG